MKIAYVSADHGIPVFGDKGASVHVQELVNAFGALGHDVRLLAARLGGPVSPTLAARTCKVRPQPSLAGGGAGDEAREVAESSRLAKERRYQAIADAIEARLIELHAEAPFDFVYERYSLWSAAGVRAARRLGVPCVVEMNAPLLEEQRRYRELVLADDAEAIEAEVLHGADHLVAVSDGVREYAIAKGSDPARAYVLPNGVDTARFHPDVVPARTAAEGPREFTIGFTGSLKPWHGMDLLMKAFRKLLTTDGRYRLLVVGDGPLRPWIDGFASGAGIEDRVELTGWIPNDALPGVLQRMDVTVAPYPRLDGFYFSPLKLFEYMAMGKPVVASAIGQVCDIVEHGRTGLLAEPGDIAQLAAHVERIRCDSDLRSRLGAAAAERARAFTWSNNARRVVELARSMSRAA